MVGIASRDKKKAAEFASRFQIPRSYDSYEAALDDSEIDAVYIPLPPSMHPEWTIRAAEAGKHILCEKPLARNVGEVDQMIAACRRNEVVLLDGVMWYHTPRAETIRSIVSSGALGELRQCTSVFTFRWDTMPMDNLRMHRQLGGGSLLDLGWYCVGATLLLFGELPQRVTAHAQWCNEVDTRLNAFLWFSENRVATIECGFDTVRRRWFELAGSESALVCDDFTRPWKPEKPRFWIHDSDGVSTEHVCPSKAQEECMVEAFAAMVRDGRTEHEWIKLSRDTQLVCDALDRSARSGESVTVHPDAA